MKNILLKFFFTTIFLFLPFSVLGSDVKEGVIRTPDSYFEDIKDYPYEPNYMVIDDLRIHYLDEGPKSAKPIFLLHGQPTWSYLFRKMIPILLEKGYRVIVPDCVGFGKSDKFISKYDYSYKHHVDVMKELVLRLDLKDATFFGQDWGGLVGLRMVAEIPDRFSAIVASNTGMVASEGIRAWLFENMVKLIVWWWGPISFEELQEAAEEALLNDNPSQTAGMIMFSKWIAYSYYSDDMNISGIIKNFGGINLTEEEIKAYNAPYPSGKYKAGAHVWPYLIPTQLRENERYWKEVYEKWDKPFLVAFGGNERITIRMKDDFINRIPNPTIITLEGAGHFVQEEVGEGLAQIISDFIEGKPVSNLPANN